MAYQIALQLGLLGCSSFCHSPIGFTFLLQTLDVFLLRHSPILIFSQLTVVYDSHGINLVLKVTEFTLMLSLRQTIVLCMEEYVTVFVQFEDSN